MNNVRIELNKIINLFLFDYILLIFYNPVKGANDPESGRSVRENKRVVEL